MKNLLKMLAVAVVFVGIAGTLSPVAAAPPSWSFDRASFGIDAKGTWGHSGDAPNASAFLPGAYLSYSVTSQLSAAATFERDFPTHLNIAQAGARFLVFKNDRGQVAGAVNLVSYSDDGSSTVLKPTSWNAAVNGSWAAVRAKNGQTTVFAIASASYDPDNDLSLIRVGLRWQVLGGHPVYEPTGL